MGYQEEKQRQLDLRYLRMAAIWAENSYCVRRKVGALIVKDKMIISDGYNGTPSGFENICEDETGRTKPYVLHAEANAITKVAKSANNCDGSTLYITAAPCIECSKLIIQAGIRRVVYSDDYRSEEGLDLLRRVGIECVNAQITFVDQKVHFFDDTVGYNLKYFKPGATEEELMEACRKAGFDKDVEKFKDGLSHRIGQDGAKLSGGQQQRVAIARALVNRPQVLLLDEPLGALDLKLRKGMQIELKKMQQRLGITFIFVTHDQEEALTMSDTIVVMNEGQIQQIGTPTDIYNEPKNVFVAKFIGESNILPGIMKKDLLVNFMGRDFECVDSGFMKNEPVDVVVRPEDIDMVSDADADAHLHGKVKSVLFMGVHYEFLVECGSVTLTIHSTDYVAPGSDVGIIILPDAIHIMHKSVKPEELDFTTADELLEAEMDAELEDKDE